MKKESRVNKGVLRKYITDLMFKYKDKADSILVLHEIFLGLNESGVVIMSNYLLSIDPSIKNTGFTLGKPVCKHNKSGNEECNVLIDKECKITSAIPILILSYDFNKYQHYDFIEKIIEPLTLKASEEDGHYKCSKYRYGVEDFNVIIERGFNNKLNVRSSEKMQALRGHIFSLLYQYYIPKKHGILPKQGQNGYYKEQKELLQ